MPMLNYIGSRTDSSKTLRVGGERAQEQSLRSIVIRDLLPDLSAKYREEVPADVPLEPSAHSAAVSRLAQVASCVRSPARKKARYLSSAVAPIRLSAVMGAAVQGCGTIIVLEPYEARRRLAKELGATYAMDPTSATNLAALVPDDRAPAGRRLSFFDTTGIPALQMSDMNCLAPHGTFGIVGISPPGTPVPVT